MENRDLVEKIISIKKEKNMRIIGHSYTPEDVQPVADSLSDSRGFFEGILNLPDDKRDIMVLGPTFFAETARMLLYDRDIKVYVPSLGECPVANHKNLVFEKIQAFKKDHPGIPMVCYAVAPLEAKFLADYLALPGEVVSTIDNVDAPEVLFVGDGNCARLAVTKCKKKVIPYPGNPFCNIYNAIDSTDVEWSRREHPDGCLLIHSEAKPEVTELADYSVGTGQMKSLIEKLNYKKYIIGSEIGFYHRMIKEFPNKEFIHLSPRLICNAFKTIRLSNVLESLRREKELIYVEPAIAKKLFDGMKKKS
jgi:quinolinate synthase